MKTKLVILLGVTLSVVSAFAVAQNLFTPPWSTEVPQGQVSVWATAVTDDVSALLPSLQGIPAEESAYLDDDKAIYISQPNDLNEKTSRRKIAENVGFIFDQRGSKILFAKKVNEAGKETGWSTDLWILNTLLEQETKVSDSVSMAIFSPSGEFIATEDSATGEVDLFSGSGVLLKKIGTYGAFPLFSPDNKKVAYYKFASDSFTRGLLNDPVGIVTYNLETGEEVLVTNSNDGGKPVAFSSDGNKLYFNSIKTSTNSLHVVNLIGHDVKKLPGDYDWRYFSVKKSAIISSDERVMVSSSENGVGIITFNGTGEVLYTKILGGTDPRWFRKDEIVAYRAHGSKGKYWEFVSVK